MIRQKSLFDIIQENIPLGTQSASGWYSIRCSVCNDHSPRGGFINDGEYTSYNCFNCGAKFKYEEGTGEVSKSTKEILNTFGVTTDKLRDITSPMFVLKSEATEEITKESLTRVNLFTPEVPFPDNCFRLLSEKHEDVQEPLIDYLINRNINPLRTDFYFSTEKKFLNRVIIPYWRDGKLIYWQARHIENGVKPRYLNCTIAKGAVIYGYDKLHSYDDTPLFVNEGVFDAILVDGISILGASLNAAKIEILKKTKRRLIFIRNRDARGDALSQTALDNGWEITTVDSRVNDVNDSVNRFGLAYTAYSLVKNSQKAGDKLKSVISLNLWGLEDRLRNRK